MTATSVACSRRTPRRSRPPRPARSCAPRRPRPGSGSRSTCEAPAAAASWAFAGLLTVVITVASAHRAELDRGVADRPGTALDQHGPPGQGAGVEPVRHRLADGEAAVRGEERDAERGAELVGRAGRQQHGLPRGHDRVLGRGAPRPPVRRLPQPDPLADQHRVDPVADRVDDAGAVVVRHLPPRRRRWRAVAAGPSSRSGSPRTPRPAPGPRPAPAPAPAGPPARAPPVRRSWCRRSPARRASSLSPPRQPAPDRSGTAEVGTVQARAMTRPASPAVVGARTAIRRFLAAGTGSSRSPRTRRSARTPAASRTRRRRPPSRG